MNNKERQEHINKYFYAFILVGSFLAFLIELTNLLKGYPFGIGIIVFSLWSIKSYLMEIAVRRRE